MSITLKAVAAVLAFIAAGPALAGDPAMQNQRAQVRMERAVFVCASDAATRRAFEREHGSTPVFVSARQAISAINAREVWSTPRCMTAREHNRLVELRTSVAAVR